jgi:hypothetical protein
MRKDWCNDIATGDHDAVGNRVTHTERESLYQNVPTIIAETIRIPCILIVTNCYLKRGQGNEYDKRDVKI